MADPVLSFSSYTFSLGITFLTWWWWGIVISPYSIYFLFVNLCFQIWNTLEKAPNLSSAKVGTYNMIVRIYSCGEWTMFGIPSVSVSILCCNCLPVASKVERAILSSSQVRNGQMSFRLIVRYVSMNMHRTAFSANGHEPRIVSAVLKARCLFVRTDQLLERLHISCSNLFHQI